MKIIEVVEVVQVMWVVQVIIEVEVAQVMFQDTLLFKHYQIIVLVHSIQGQLIRFTLDATHPPIQNRENLSMNYLQAKVKTNIRAINKTKVECGKWRLKNSRIDLQIVAWVSYLIMVAMWAVISIWWCWGREQEIAGEVAKVVDQTSITYTTIEKNSFSS